MKIIAVSLILMLWVAPAWGADMWWALVRGAKSETIDSPSPAWGAYGASWNYPSKQEAIDAATKECKKRGAGWKSYECYPQRAWKIAVFPSLDMKRFTFLAAMRFGMWITNSQNRLKHAYPPKRLRKKRWPDIGNSGMFGMSGWNC